MLAFLVGSKQDFEVSLADVSQAQLQGRTDVVLEFHVDDTTGANGKDSLIELRFHEPNTNTTFIGDEARTPAQIFQDKIMQMVDVGRMVYIVVCIQWRELSIAKTVGQSLSIHCMYQPNREPASN